MSNRFEKLELYAEYVARHPGAGAPVGTMVSQRYLESRRSDGEEAPVV